jgi:phosphoserine phosphatase RsbU/P
MDRFVTLIAAILEPETHTVTMINAGHPSPFLYRKATGEFTKAFPVDLAGSSLGITEGNDYQAVQVKLEPGDSLLIYSDGVTDAQSAAGRPFRTKGIQAVLEKNVGEAPKSLGDRLVKAIQRHSTGVPPYDDITLVCFGRTA